jgi:TolB-like protein
MNHKIGLLLIFLLFPLVAKPQESLDSNLSNLVNQIVNGIHKEGKTKIAVVEFSDLNGHTSVLGKFLAEELITRLFITNKFEVIERQLLNKIIEEHKLNFTGLIDPNSAKELGRILGVEAIISGTITDLNESIKINARLISTETGQIFSVASIEIPKNNDIRKLMGLPTISNNSNSIKNTDTKGTNNDIFFKEDFSEYEIGDMATSWGNNIAVKRSINGQNYIDNQSETNTLTHEIIFPKDFAIEFDLYAHFSLNPDKLIFVDSNEDELLITISWDQIDLNGIKSPRLTNNWGDSKLNHNKWNTIKIISIGSVFKIYLNDEFVVSGSFPKYSNFVRIKYITEKDRYLKNFIGRTLY